MAINFAGNVLLEINIPRNLPNAKDISANSAMRHEKEILFTPWSAFDINYVNLRLINGKNLHVFEMTAKDNATAGIDYIPLTSIILVSILDLDAIIKLCYLQ
jgi:hypothetical protein